ncbi:ribosomal protein S23, retrogene 1 [Mus musculus]|uniref:Ribosomal protein S23, retrogene 1 n=2 Tax=Mus musculus TaxID=10090 RepID=Q8C7T0_MOUSE|nr:ribosomal protein S23, retrogene 1 [Mus musculus]AAH89480.1 RIKEN cDNA C330021F23 gene [Mus musculus]BAC33674.1 unnamed protein product [Mus musculus]|eukprot:NP_001019899.1 ribosomal protein S23 like protein [Mus musculus]
MQSQQRNIGYFNHLKADSRNITYSMTFSTKSSNQNFIIFLNEVQAAIIGHERCDLLPVLNELHPDALPDGRIWLFGLNPYFFQHNSLCMRGTPKRIGLQGCAQVGFLVLFVMPLLIPSVTAELPGSSETTTLAHLAGATGP